MDINGEKSKEENILGLSTNELAGLTVDEVTNNKTAITMIMHYYKQLVDKNNSLRNDNNTLQTYLDSYKRKKTYTSVGAALLASSNIFTGFGINLITTNQKQFPGWALLIGGLCLLISGLFFSYKD
jgi:hypothetical protein